MAAAKKSNKSTMVWVRMEPAHVRALDRWRRANRHPMSGTEPTRSEAIRVLVCTGLAMVDMGAATEAA